MTREDDARVADLVARLGDADATDLFRRLVERGMQDLIDAELSAAIGGECYRTQVEVLLAGGELLSDRSLLEGATEAFRGQHAFPSHTTLFRFCAGADFGRAQKAAAVNRTMLARVFGSVALGTATETSCVDILIDVPASTG